MNLKFCLDERFLRPSYGRCCLMMSWVRTNTDFRCLAKLPYICDITLWPLYLSSLLHVRMCRLLVKVSEQVIFQLLISSELDSLYNCIVYCLIKNYRQQLILYPRQNLVVSLLLIGTKKYLYLCLFNAPLPCPKPLYCFNFSFHFTNAWWYWYLVLVPSQPRVRTSTI